MFGTLNVYYPNIHIHKFCKRLSSILECVFPVSVLKSRRVGITPFLLMRSQTVF